MPCWLWTVPAPHGVEGQPLPCTERSQSALSAHTPTQVLVMEWIDGIRCTDPASIKASGLDVDGFIRCGVVRIPVHELERARTRVCVRL